MPRILIVDDEPEMLRGLEDNLQFEGYQTVTAGDGKKGLALALSEAPDLILLDVMMPGMSGWDLCRELRRRGLDVPVIMLTARGEEVDRVLGLELGADDYVTKPFSLRELMARIRAVLRRPGPRQKFEEFAFGTVRVHLRARQAFKAGQEIRLTRKEFGLLRYLVEHPGEVIRANGAEGCGGTSGFQHGRWTRIPEAAAEIRDARSGGAILTAHGRATVRHREERSD